MFTHFSLFSGIGGIDLAAEWAGFTTVGQCEFADYPYAVLQKHWPDVPKWRDIRTVTKESIDEKLGEGSEITLLSGGFPCQPVSCAGKRRGKADDRWLWPEMLRVIRELRPHWVLGENVAGLTNMVEFFSDAPVDGQGNPIGTDGEIFTRTGRFALYEVLEELEKIGYNVRAFLIPACGVEALHRRERIFIVAHARYASRIITDSNGAEAARQRQYRGAGLHSNQERPCESNNDVAHSGNEGLERSEQFSSHTKGTIEGETCPLGPASQCGADGRGFRKSESGLGGGTYGVSATLDRDIVNNWSHGWEDGIPRVTAESPRRADRLKCLGNAVVPQQVYPIVRSIYTVEQSLRQVK